MSCILAYLEIVEVSSLMPSLTSDLRGSVLHIQCMTDVLYVQYGKGTHNKDLEELYFRFEAEYLTYWSLAINSSTILLYTSSPQKGIFSNPLNKNVREKCIRTVLL